MIHKLSPEELKKIARQVAELGAYLATTERDLFSAEEYDRKETEFVTKASKHMLPIVQQLYALNTRKDEIERELEKSKRDYVHLADKPGAFVRKQEDIEDDINRLRKKRDSLLSIYDHTNKQINIHKARFMEYAEQIATTERILSGKKADLKKRLREHMDAARHGNDVEILKLLAHLDQRIDELHIDELIEHHNRMQEEWVARMRKGTLSFITPVGRSAWQ